MNNFWNIHYPSVLENRFPIFSKPCVFQKWRSQAVSILGRLAARYCGKDCITGIQARFITGFPMDVSMIFPGGSGFKFPLNQSIECSFYIHHI